MSQFFWADICCIYLLEPYHPGKSIYREYNREFLLPTGGEHQEKGIQNLVEERHSLYVEAIVIIGFQAQIDILFP